MSYTYRREAIASFVFLLVVLAAWSCPAMPARADAVSAGQTAPQSPSPPPGYAPGEAGYASVRLGILPSNSSQFVVGLDFTLTRLRLSPAFVTRVDADLFAPFNTRQYTNTPKSRLGLTLDEVYVGNPTAHHGFYAGLGIGPYYQVNPHAVRFGAKLFIGANFSRILSAEVGVHFPGSDETIVSLEGRVALY